MHGYNRYKCSRYSDAFHLAQQFSLRFFLDQKLPLKMRKIIFNAHPSTSQVKMLIWEKNWRKCKFGPFISPDPRIDCLIEFPTTKNTLKELKRDVGYDSAPGFMQFSSNQIILI